MPSRRRNDSKQMSVFPIGTAIKKRSKCSIEAAIASNIGTPMCGMPRAAERPRVVERPIRRPVKLPGPVDTAIASNRSRSTPQVRRSISIFGSNSSARVKTPLPKCPDADFPLRMIERLPPAIAASTASTDCGPLVIRSSPLIYS